MSDEQAAKILKRFKAAEGRKVNWEETYREAQEYVCPQRETFDEFYVGENKDEGQRVFDSTAFHAAQTFASNLQSDLLPPMKEWVSLTTGPMVESNDQIKQELEDITDILFTKLKSSNFDTQIAESLMDLCIGTGAFLVFAGTKERPFNFVNVPLSQLYLEEGPYGRIDVAFRQFKLAARAIEEQWPAATLTKEIKDLIKDQPDKQMCFIEATFPERVTIWDKTEQSFIEVDGYTYNVVCKDTNQVILTQNMRSSPWVIFRWSNLPGEIYGRGPALTALPAIKTLNQQVKILLMSASISTLGMWTAADDGVVNLDNIRLEPGAIIPVTSNAGSVQGPTLAPLQTGGRVDMAQLVIEAQQSAINKIMYGDPLGDVNLPVKTATEMSLRQQELAKRIGSAYGKLQFELVGPLVNRLLDVLDEVGLIDLGNYRVDGSFIAIEHKSPLATAQDETDVLKHIRFVETMLNMFGPEATMGIVNVEALADYLGDKINIASGILRSPEERQALKQQAAQQMQQQAM